MAAMTKLSARVRSEFGKGPVGRMRRAGRIPGVVYRAGREPVSLDIDAEELGRMMKHAASEHILLELTVAGEEGPRSVLIEEIQRDILTDGILHIDFHEVSLTEKLRARIPVEPRGAAAGAKEGGTLEQVLHEIEVECLPHDLPGALDVDVSPLRVGDTLHVRDLKAPDGVVFTANPELVVFSVAAARVAEVEAVPAGEAAEPEVVSGEDEAKAEGGES